MPLLRPLLVLLAAALATLALSLLSPGADPAAVAYRGDPGLDPVAPVPAAPRVGCGRPATLRLRRFEDGSAWLLCAGRVLVRVSVPR